MHTSALSNSCTTEGLGAESCNKDSVLSTMLDPTKCLANSSFFVTVSVTSEEMEARRRGRGRQLRNGSQEVIVSRTCEFPEQSKELSLTPGAG